MTKHGDRQDLRNADMRRHALFYAQSGELLAATTVHVLETLLRSLPFIQTRRPRTQHEKDATQALIDAVIAEYRALEPWRDRTCVHHLDDLMAVFLGEDEEDDDKGGDDGDEPQPPDGPGPAIHVDADHDPVVRLPSSLEDQVREVLTSVLH